MIPGVSRSGSTIVGALLLGADKRSATEFSFYLAMPTMAGAFAYDLYKNHAELTLDDVVGIALGFVVSFGRPCWWCATCSTSSAATASPRSPGGASSSAAWASARWRSWAEQGPPAFPEAEATALRPGPRPSGILPRLRWACCRAALRL